MPSQTLNKKTLRARTLVFWSFVVVLISAISTNIFSETTLNDNLAIGFMVIALIGLLFSAATILIHTILDICNP
ncbi:hypothetical protein F7P75_01885 [Acinetobacter gandensis]|uniref:Uncharacterized protein n=1 Tax=Acinetobacter gandensis TaxID=1443941 RepID=A0A1A7RA00_9GAMM|nr:hypothetical protein [Acinetobacter gandensis]KAB0629132.1 hypothetical protein F7P75_01885 [Acinetobacter gandensis]OBX29085.1 hypothetical protein A9J31_01980 [Acinetobacter gandensis]